MEDDSDITRLGRAIAARGNRYQVHWLTVWGYAREPRASWGRVLHTPRRPA